MLQAALIFFSAIERGDLPPLPPPWAGPYEVEFVMPDDGTSCPIGAVLRPTPFCAKHGLPIIIA